MRVVVQKCLRASVTIDNKIYNKINNGYMLLVAFTQGDDASKINWMINKITHLRIFEDVNNVMNLSILDVKGEILSISQFTLYGDATNGNRPSYTKALNGTEAIHLYEEFNNKMNSYIPTKTGIFGADMKVELINNGPTTIILEK
jgi:D-tyrosyl-tRNA(Tyr) deacylase